MADLTVVAASVLKGSSVPSLVTAGATLTAGQYVYLDTATSTYKLSDADGSSGANAVDGVTLGGAASGQPIAIIPATSGDATFVHGFTGVVAGDTIYLSDTPGAATKTFADLEAGDKIIVLGVAVSATVMNFKPIVGGSL